MMNAITSFSRKPSVRAIAVLVCALVLSGCDSWAESKFQKFCEENILPLPAEKISTKGIEFRGSFYLNGIGWEKYTEYVEFSKNDIGSQSPSRSEFRRPRELKHPKYRMEIFEDWSQECSLYWVRRKAPEQLGDEFFRTEKQYMQDHPETRCQGIYPVEVFTAEHIVERIDIPDFSRVSGRKIFARIFRVTARDTGQVVGELRAYHVTSHPWFQGFAEVPQGYVCTSIEGIEYLQVRNLENIFAPIE